MAGNVINAKFSYLRTLILKLASLTKIGEDYDWMKPKLRNFTSKKRSERNGYVHQNGVRRCTMHFVYVCVDFNNGSITT